MKIHKRSLVLVVTLLAIAQMLAACPGVLTTPPASEAPTSILSETTEPSSQ
jgi:hypothetical protein